MSERDEHAELVAELDDLRGEQRRLFERIAANERHFRGLARSVMRVQEEERRRFARDLHDGIGQNLTALKHRLQAMQEPAGQNPAWDEALAQALQICVDTLEDTRSLSRMLRPQILDDLGLESALRWLARSSGDAGKFEVEVEIDALPESLDPDIATLVFRVAQEGFANIIKHARAGRVLLRLRLRGGHLQLLLVDDGVGTETALALESGRTSRSSGVAGMRERAEMFGAQLRFISAPGEGTQIRLLVPLQRDDGNEGSA